MVNATDHDFGAETPDLGGFMPRAAMLQPRFLDVLLHRKRSILSVALVVAGIFAAYANWATPIFTAEALVVTNQPEFGQEVSPLAASRDTQAAALLSEIDLIKSPAFTTKISRQFDLTNDPEFKGSSSWFEGGTDAASGTVENPASGPTGSFIEHVRSLADNAVGQVLSFLPRLTPQDDNSEAAASGQLDEAQMARTTRSIGRHLSISNDGHSVTIQIKFWSTDPYKASKIANAFADNYVQDKLETKQRQSTQINTWLDGRLVDLRRRVVAADRAVQEERQRLNIPTAGSAGTLSDQALLQWNMQLVTVQAKRLEAEARLATAKSVLTGESPTQSTSDVLGSPLIQRLAEQKGLLTAQYANMVSRSGPRYPPTVALERQIDDLSQSLQTETKKIVNSLAKEVETARRAENDVTNSLEVANRNANASQLELTTVRELEQRAASERLLYDQFLRRFNETLGHNYLPQSDVRTISPAAPPDRPSYPKMEIFAPAGFLLGLFFGVVRALHSAGSDRNFKAVPAVEAATGLTVLGSVPARKSYRVRKTATLATDAYFEQSVARVAATLGHLGRPGQPPKVVAITSALPKEGKSTFCAALARSAAQSGKRVLVIDFDRYSRTLSQIFRNPVKSGDLMDLIAGTKTPGQVVQRDQLSDVDFMPIMERYSITQQIISSARMHSAFRDLLERYDLILVDTPPVLANTDIAALVDVIDACLFVVHWGETPRHAVTTALRQIHLMNLPVAGIVVTRVDPADVESEAAGAFYGQIARYQAHRRA